jgi:hypothetical protein
MSRPLPSVFTFGVCMLVISPLRADESQTNCEKAVALVKKLGGRVEVDEKAKDAPIVAVHLSDTNVNDAVEAVQLGEWLQCFHARPKVSCPRPPHPDPASSIVASP